MLTNHALSLLRECLKTSIDHAGYKTAENDYTAQIQTTEVLSDGRISASFMIDGAATGTSAVTEVRLFAADGSMLASKAENITRRNTQESILYRFRFDIREEE